MNPKLMMVFLFTFLLNASLAIGQKQIWNIYTVDDQPYSGVVLNQIAHDTLYVKTSGNVYGLPINSIAFLKHERKSRAGIGFLSGMVLGGLYMNYNARKSSEQQSKFPIDAGDLSVLLSTSLGMAGGGILGATIGSAMGRDEFFTLSKLSLQEKRELIKKLLAR